MRDFLDIVLLIWALIGIGFMVMGIWYIGVAIFLISALYYIFGGESDDKDG